MVPPTDGPPDPAHDFGDRMEEKVADTTAGEVTEEGAEASKKKYNVVDEMTGEEVQPGAVQCSAWPARTVQGAPVVGEVVGQVVDRVVGQVLDELVGKGVYF